MNIDSKIVKELRDITKLPMMACKKALVEMNGNIEEATEFLRKKFTDKIDVSIYKGKRTGVYCIAGFVGNIFENAGAECIKCHTFINENDILKHKC